MILSVDRIDYRFIQRNRLRSNRTNGTSAESSPSPPSSRSHRRPPPGYLSYPQKIAHRASSFKTYPADFLANNTRAAVMVGSGSSLPRAMQCDGANGRIRRRKDARMMLVSCRQKESTIVRRNQSQSHSKSQHDGLLPAPPGPGRAAARRRRPGRHSGDDRWPGVHDVRGGSAGRRGSANDAR